MRQEIFHMFLGATVASIVGIVSSWITERYKDRKQLKINMHEILFHVNELVDSFKQSQMMLKNGINGEKYVPILKDKFFQTSDYSSLTNILAMLKEDFQEEVRKINDFVRQLKRLDNIANDYYNPNNETEFRQVNYIAYERSLLDIKTDDI